MTKVFIVDSAKCSGCYNCQIACKDEHVGNVWAPYAAAQPNSGQFWIKVDETEHGQGDKVRVEYTPKLCNHCEECPLVKIAPDAVYRRDDGLVIIDPQKAAGRRDLVDACPYGAVYWNEKLELPQKCTGCAHLVDEGKLPHCVDFCATGGLRFGDAEVFADEIAQAELLDDSIGLGAHVYYINRPHLFIAGDVWDPEPDEIVEGATVTLTMPDGTTRTTLTDDFGDFYFRRIDAGSYKVRVEADGYQPVEREVQLEKSLNLGDFPLQKA